MRTPWRGAYSADSAQRFEEAATRVRIAVEHQSRVGARTESDRPVLPGMYGVLKKCLPRADVHPPPEAEDGGMSTQLLAARPRRSLLAILLFVVIAGVVGGPVAGKLDDSGGFVAPGADSELAIDRIEAATGTQADAAIAVLVDAPSPARVSAVAARLAEVPAVVRTDSPGQANGRALVTATLSADADDGAAAQSALDAFADRRDVSVGGSAVADLQIGETVSADLGRAEAIAFPILVLLSLLFFRGRAALMPLVIGVTTVLGTFLVLSGVNAVYGLNIFALNLVIGLGLGLSIDYTLSS